MTNSEMTISKLKVLGCKIREMYDSLYKYKVDNHIGLIDTKNDIVFPDIWNKINSNKELVYLYGEDNEALYINGNLYESSELNRRFGIVHLSDDTFTNQNCDYLHIIESDSNRCALYNRKLDRMLILKNLPDCGSSYNIELNVYREHIKNGETEKLIDVYEIKRDFEVEGMTIYGNGTQINKGYVKVIIGEIVDNSIFRKANIRKDDLKHNKFEQRHMDNLISANIEFEYIDNALRKDK